MADRATLSPPTRRGSPAVGPSAPAGAVGSGADIAVRLATLVLFAVAVWLGLQSLSAVPDVVASGAPADVFSAERAMTDLRAIAAAPRPVGSPANAATRDYLLARIREMGLEPQVQAAAVLRHEPGFPETHQMAVENVLVRVPGTEPGGKALLVSGHYDSVATATGASDCGMCSAVALETLRAVAASAAAGRPPRNDVIFLFTDGEELGVAGAAGFMREHPWAADVGLSLVFEGLGSDGAPLLYITGPESGAIVAEALDALGRGSRFPLASSFLHDFMWTVAGNTGSDLDAFVEGAPGLGFIYLSLDTVASYHTSTDSAANLDPRSLQGMGDFALALTRHFGDRPLDDLPAAPNLVLFPLWPGAVAHYSTAAALPLAVAAAVALLALLAVGLRRRELSLLGLTAGFAAWLLGLLTAVAAVSLVWWLARLLTPGLHNFTAGGWWGSGFYLAGSLALALAVAAGWRGLWSRRVAAGDLVGGGLVWWAILALLTAAALPGLSYLFVWPLIIAAAGGLLAGRLPRDDRRRALPVVLAAAAALLLAAPVAYWLWIYAGRAEAMMGLPMAALPVLFVWPALWLALEALAGDTKYEIRDTSSEARSSVVRRPSFVIVAIFLLSLLLFAVPGLMRPSPQRTWANAVVYTLDADRGEARWVTFNDSRAGRGTRYQLDDWTRQFFAAGAEESTFDPWLLTRSDTPYPALQSVAGAVDLPRTSVTGGPDGGRTRLLVARPAEAWLTRLVVRSAAPIAGITLDGRALDLAGTRPVEYTFVIIGGDDEVAIDLAGAGPVTVEVLDRLVVDVAAIAAATGLAVAPRPEWMTAAAAADTADGALVAAAFRIGE